MSHQVFSSRRGSGYYDPEKIQRSSVRRRRSNKSSKGLWIAGAVILVLLCAAAAYFFYYKSDPVGSSEDIQIYAPESEEYEVHNEESAFDPTAHGEENNHDAEERVEVDQSLFESEEPRNAVDPYGMFYTDDPVPIVNVYLDDLPVEALENPETNNRANQNFDFQELDMIPNHENPSEDDNARNTDHEDAENISNIHINEVNNLTASNEQEHEELEVEQDYVEVSESEEDEDDLEGRISDDFLVY